MAAKIEGCHLKFAVLFIILGFHQALGNWKCADKTCEGKSCMKAYQRPHQLCVTGKFYLQTAADKMCLLFEDVCHFDIVYQLIAGLIITCTCGGTLMILDF